MENAIWKGKCLVACEVAEDYDVEKEVRKASYSGELRCPDEGCLSPILKYCHGEIREPYFAHRDNVECDYVVFEKNAGVFHGLRVFCMSTLRLVIIRSKWRPRCCHTTTVICTLSGKMVQELP